MAKFDLITCVYDPAIHQACDLINDMYFDDDTANDADWANTDQAYGWFDKNNAIFTAALLNGEPVGFYELLPLTKEATEKFVAGGVTEDQIYAEHIVENITPCPAYGAYLSGIAVRKGLSPVLAAHCNAALFAGLLQDLFYRYDKNTLRWVITNPVSSMGLSLMQHFGLEPMNVHANALEDTFLKEITPEWRAEWQSKQRIYQLRHVSSYKSGQKPERPFRPPASEGAGGK